MHLWCGNTIAVSGFLFGNWDTLAMQLITQAYPVPSPPPFSLPLSKHVCTALCGFHFHCESENANGCCTSVWLCFFCFFYFFIIFFLFCFSFSLPGSIRWFYHQWRFSICGPALLCFRCLKWFHILAVSPSLLLSLSLFLLSCVHAIFAHLLRFVEHSHRCLGIPSSAFTIFAVHCGTVDFLSGHWAVEGSTGEEGSAALFVQF